LSISYPHPPKSIFSPKFLSTSFRSSPLSFELLNPPHLLIFSFPNLLIFSLPVWLTLPVRLAPHFQICLFANYSILLSDK
ncbi:hypothetical protein HMPREF9078_02426, partial [Capnocytophaga sp. oral taxon 380 str. F0488]